MDVLPNCAFCGYKGNEKRCRSLTGQAPTFCPTIHQEKAIGEAQVQYKEPEIHEFARQASIQEAECYLNRDQKPLVRNPVKSRLQEIIEFSRRMGYHRLGLAFCAGLQSEAKITAEILQRQGFEVVSVICKVGAIPKEEIGVLDSQKVAIGEYESMCNPIAQAEILNRAETDFNIMLGLCVGHDSLFIKYAKAMTTVFAVKDRLLGHNPLAVIYTSGSYYEKLYKSEIYRKYK
jgi:uncharacterized metal-binding protein